MTKHKTALAGGGWLLSMALLCAISLAQPQSVESRAEVKVYHQTDGGWLS
jgi:hypothetical protein